MTIQQVVTGQDVPPELKKSNWNAFVDAANRSELSDWRNHTITGTAGAKEDPTTTVKVEATAALMERRQVFGLVTPSIPASTNDKVFRDRMLFLDSTQQLGRFGLTRREVIQGSYGMAEAGGIVQCKLYVPANGDFIDRADIDSTDNQRLRAQLNGSAQILWKETGTDATVDAVVRLGNAQNVHVLGKAAGDIPAGGTGTVRVWKDTTTDTGYNIEDEAGITAAVYHDWMDGDIQISNGKEVIATWFPYEGRWRITHAECEDPAPVIGQLGMAVGVDTQVVTANTPVAISVFDVSENLATPNVTLDTANASIQIPDVPAGGKLYKLSVSSTFLAPSNNTTISFWPYINGIQATTPLSTVTVQNAANSQTIAVNGFSLIPQSVAPTLALWIESDSSGTITYTTITYNIEDVRA